MKLISWNLNGIRAVAQKGLLSIINDFQADIICFQETKAQDDQVKEVLNQLEGYHIAVSSADKKGYSGTAILSKIRPVSVQYGLNIAEHDNEGRLITAEFDNFYLLTVYVPNSQNELARLPYRTKWDADLLAFIKTLDQKKPVIICGDMNVAHQPIDLANPKANFNKTAGYTQQEIEGMDNFIKAGFTDSFRALYPREIKYSWWSYRFNSRAKNIGWRIDYFLLSDRLVPGLNDAFIMNEVEGSDHCPVGITINL
jgi:exodeoxyribonuclease III